MIYNHKGKHWWSLRHQGSVCGCTDRFTAQMFINWGNGGNIAQQQRQRPSDVLHLNICTHVLLSDFPGLHCSVLSISCGAAPLLSSLPPPRARDP